MTPAHAPRAAPVSAAPVFAALGDTTRLGLLAALSLGTPLSIIQLAEGSGITRQGVTKHLKVLEAAGLVASTRAGRETRFRFQPEAVGAARGYLDEVSAQWDQSLARLKAFVES